MIPDRFQPTISQLQPIAARFEEHGFRLYIVGGALRDLLLGENPTDIDLTTDAEPSDILSVLTGTVHSINRAGERFGTIVRSRRRQTNRGRADHPPSLRKDPLRAKPQEDHD